MSFVNKGKVGKVMREFKSGALHSGSKGGPKVTSPAQAKAIAMSEAGMSKKGYASGGTVQEGTSKGMRGTGAAQRGTKTRGYIGSD